MTTPLQESISILDSLMSGLASTVLGPSAGPQDASFRRLYGDIIAYAPELLTDRTLPTPLLQAFELATSTGATLLGYELFRQQVLATPYTSSLAQGVNFLFLWFTLAQEATIIANTVYTSRQDADADLNTIDAAFTLAEIDVADSSVSVYQQMIYLHAAVVRDLVNRSLLLPQVIRYNFTRNLPSLTMAQRLYPDDALTLDRSGELILENKVIHPAFMPQYGVCLGA